MNALFLKLLNMSAAGSVLILAVVLLRALFKRAPRWIICVMWAVVAVRLVCPVSIASPVSAFRATPSLVSESGEVEVFRSAGGSEKPLLAVDTVQIERPRANAETITEIPGTSLAVTQRSRDTYLPPLMQGYLLGLAVMLLYALISTLLLRKKVSVSLRQRGNIRLCDEVASPFILGIFRPVIYLPSSLSEEEKRFVLAHERAHLRRLDYIWKPVGFLILSLHWFNPFCWLSYVLLCRDIELACDEKVIRELGHTERAAYSQTLLNCSAHRILAACPVAFGETDVRTRVKAVLNYKKPAFWIILAAVLACIVLIVCFAANPIQEQDLSFLNYKNAISLIGQNDTAPYANLYPADSDGVQPGVADAKALAQFLENAEWTKRRAPSSSPEPRGYLEFLIEDDYRIIVYQSERLAAVRFGSDIRYYRTGAGDYETALATFIPAPSTEPDLPPEQTVRTEISFMSLDDTVEYIFSGDSSFSMTDLPVVEVVPHEITAEEAARLADALFPHAAYTGYVFDAPRTKSDLKASMERWRNYLTDGTLSDLFCGDEDILADMETVIGRWEDGFSEKMAAAPEAETKIPAQWIFHPDSDVWAGGDPETEAIRAIVDCGGLKYSFCAANRAQNDYSVHMIYGSLENKSSPNNVDALLQQYELCRSPQPTPAQITAIMEKARSALAALNVGEWRTDLFSVERLPRGQEEAYVITVKAVPVFQSNAVIRFAQLENMRSDTEGARHFYYSNASFSFAPDGTLLDFSIYSLIDIIHVRDDVRTLNTNELMEEAKDRLLVRGIAYYRDYYPVANALSAKVYIHRMTYGLVRVEIENGKTYQYVPALCLDGFIQLYDEYGNLLFESLTDGLYTRMLVLNALDGTEIVFSSNNSFTHIP